MYQLLRKVLFKLDPETAHELAIKALKTQNYLPLINYKSNYSNLKNNLLGIDFKNPIGLAAGFDKNAEVVAPLSKLDFGFIEIGAITPKPQLGNPRPRIQRLVSELSIKNAMGFNNCGIKTAKENLNKLNYSQLPPIFINIGKNKVTPNEEAINDYEELVKELAPFADAFVINISSPNTPNLRDLQNEKFLNELFTRLNEINSIPKFIKLAPDMDFQEAKDLCVCALESKASGVILSNTTQDYSLSKENIEHCGGISGMLLAQKSLNMLKAIAPSIYKKGIIISSGGIFNALDVCERLEYGASLVQIYSAMIYKGPKLARTINDDLNEYLLARGIDNINKLIGIKL